MTVEEYGTTYTTLTMAQIPLIQRLSEFLPFASSITRQKVSVFAIAKDQQFLVFGFCTRKEAVLLEHNVNLIPMESMPAWQEAIFKGEGTRSLYHYNQERTAAIFTFPIVDNGGKIIGGVSFVDPRISEVVDPLFYDNAFILAETTYMTMMVPSLDPDVTYEPVSYQDGIIIFNDQGNILFANTAASRLVDVLGFDRRLVGASVFGGTLKLSLLLQAIKEHRSSVTEEIYDDLIIEQILLPVGWANKQRRYFLILKDKTVIRKKEQELLVKNSVIKEIHHRVKNNLQTIAAILRMEARRSSSEPVKLALQEGIHRIESMALVHEVVSHYDEDYISLRIVTEELMRLLTRSLVPKNFHLLLTYEGEDVIMSSTQGGYLSLIMNELFTNSILHGFVEPMIQEGTIAVEAHKTQEGFTVSVCDDGVGLGESFQWDTDKHLGLEIIQNLVHNELGGQLHMERNSPRGTIVTITCERGD